MKTLYQKNPTEETVKTCRWTKIQLSSAENKKLPALTRNVY